MSALEEEPTYFNTTYERIRQEVSAGDGFADVVLETTGGSPFIVIEAKRPPDEGESTSRDIDPYSQPVYSQAAGYAMEIGAPYFATYNARHLVIFRTFEAGTSLLDRKTRAYEISDIGAFTPEFLEELAGLDVDEVEWDPHQDAFVKRLHSFHDILQAEFDKRLYERLDSDDDDFEEEYELWIRGQGWMDDYEDEPEEIHSTYTSQAAYLLMNRLVFYKLLENADAYENVPVVALRELVEPSLRRETFEALMESVDFEAVYEQDAIFDQLRLTDRARREVSSLLDDLEEYNLDQFDEDVIGKIYENIIPPSERHALGQYYTPDKIVKLITQLTVTRENDVVMDPGCGSGGFLVGAYNQLQEEKGGNQHEEILDQIFGVDINRFPGHLSAINLALRNLSHETHNVNIRIDDFFSLRKGQGTVTHVEHATTSGSSENGEYEVNIPPKIDVAVANPPYIRNENIEDPEFVRESFDDLGLDLDERSDIYVYFFTHAYQFLRQGEETNEHPASRMGFLTSNRWLTTGYGEDLQEFFLNHVKIKAIIDFRTQQFEVPLISTCVTILERCDDPTERDENQTILLHLKQEHELDDILEILEEEGDTGKLQDNDAYRRVDFRQGDLRQIDRWDRYLYAPAIYWELIDHDQICELNDLAQVKFGTKTGNNTYFYFQTEEEYEEFGLDDRYVTPILKHISPTEYTELRLEDPHWYVLDLHDVVEEILANTSSSIMAQQTDEEIVKEEFEDRGWDDLLSYLEHGEEQDVDEGSSVQNTGRVWFDVGDMPVPELTLAKEYWRDARVLYNQAGIPLDQRNYEVDTRNGVDPIVLLGMMNSSIFAVIREVEGRREQGQAMDRNELTVGEAKGLNVPDIRTFSSEEKEKIRNIMTEWMEEERTASDEEIEEFQRRLDEIVLDIMGLAGRTEEIEEAVKTMIEMREKGGGEQGGVLISERTPEREIELPGASRISDGGGGQQSLDSWQ